ncbi:MAG: X-Pro dipeptidyl-peptidase [Candidatus Nephthysia bennettiae]|uniref:CocE/NonD family hydrolase n=1 Tax=Candidatus Nephthysia bennettiae TaxID=3127016 RepID=A0A934K8V7_9BACT|nr:CocE/NonD family hydrolase [Candidatus Dormibacteraeota bacterium]MBJ7612552.1 CocE/NonD family hydrolase [Candidatus Dormibacteraeota bacterium]PZR87526.1 MAG: X-Pro dipeptidyl-peptidase [Candidatus Dormibacteraeota bacterium]
MEPEQSVTVDLNVPAPMRDGVVLRSNVYRPAGAGRWPILLTRLPYGKDLPLGSSVIDPVQAARHGYVVIVQDTRGRFSSEGDWYPLRNEAEDGHDTVQWAASLPYSDGQVGMYGASYFGFTQWSAALTAPPALKAIVPFITWSEPYNGLAFRGGALELGIQAHWHLQMGFDVLLRRHRGDLPALGRALHGLAGELDQLAPEGYASLPLREFGPLVRQDVAPAFFDYFRAAVDRSELGFASISGRHHQASVPSFNAGGWYDIFLQDTIANYQAMRQLGQPSKLLIGPWSHGSQRNPIGELSFGFGSQAALIDLRIDFQSLQLRWFDRWLKGADNGMMSEPPVQIFVMGANTWRQLEEWPPPAAVPTQLYLREGGLLSSGAPGDERPEGFEYDPADPVPTRGGALLLSPEYPSGPYDQQQVEARPDVLVFTSQPLERDTEVTGPVRVELWAASSAPDTDFVARLCDVHPDGRSINLTDGVVRARYRDWASGARPSLIEPGRPLCYDIDLWSTSNLFKAGHRIRLQVTSSNFPRWDRNPNTGHDLGADSELAVARQTIFHDRERPSHLLLPILS